MLGSLEAGFLVLFCYSVMLDTENSLSHQSFIQELDGVCSSPKWKNVLLKRCFISSLPSLALLYVIRGQALGRA